MKVLLEITKTPTKDDILIFNGTDWEPIRRSQYMKDVILKQNETNDNLSKLEEKFMSFAKIVDEKLKNHHEALQLLIKEEEE